MRYMKFSNKRIRGDCELIKPTNEQKNQSLIFRILTYRIFKNENKSGSFEIMFWDR